MTEFEDVVQALVDGEPVDQQALERALADPEGRAHLIDLLVLRGFLRNSTLAQPVAGNRREARGLRLRWLSVAALIVAVASLGGYVAGERRAASRAAADSSVANAAVDAPAPTHVIRFEPGVDWTEKKGGH